MELREREEKDLERRHGFIFSILHEREREVENGLLVIKRRVF